MTCKGYSKSETEKNFEEPNFRIITFFVAIGTTWEEKEVGGGPQEKCLSRQSEKLSGIGIETKNFETNLTIKKIPKKLFWRKNYFNFVNLAKW